MGVNGILQDSLPLPHTLLAVLLQLSISSLKCCQVELLTLPDQFVMLLHTNLHLNGQDKG